MAKYVGKRIVPLPCGEWVQNKEYEMLSVVLHTATGDSYMARRQVPAGTAITDKTFWAKSSDYSQQFQNVSDQLTETLRQVRADNDATEQAIRQDNDATEQAIRQDNAATKQHVDDSLAETTQDLTGKVTTAIANLNEGRSQLTTTAAALTARLDSIAGQHTTDTEVLDARVDADGDSYENLGNAIRGSYNKLKAETDKAFDTLSDLNGFIRLPPFEHGVVENGGGGIVYLSTTTRIRSKEGVSLPLKAGDTIHADDWSAIYFFGIYKNAAGEYVSFTTRNWDYVMPEDGEFYFCARNPEGSVIEDVDALASHLMVIRPANLKSETEGLSDRVDCTNEALAETNHKMSLHGERLANIDGEIPLPAFESGTLVVSNEGPQYYNNLKRIRFVQGTSLPVKAGDTITSDHWGEVHYLGGYENSAGEYIGFDTRSRDYVMPEDGELYICARNTEGSDISDINALASMLKVVRPSNLTADVEALDGRQNAADEKFVDTDEKITAIHDRLGDLDGFIPFPPFELGVLEFENGEVVYRNTSARMRFAQGTFVSLKAGDIIHPVESGTVYFFGGFFNAEGELTSFVTRGSDYVMPEDGDFYLCARHPDGSAIEDVDELASHLVIIRPANVTARVESLESMSASHENRLAEKETEHLKPNCSYYTNGLVRMAYNPYKPGGSLVLTGQLHCHTKHKDSEGNSVYYGGTDASAMQLYKDCGYDFLTVTNYGHMGEIYRPAEGTMPEGLTWLCDGQEAAINGSGTPGVSAFPCKHSCVFNTKEAYPWMPEMEWQDWAEMTKPKGEIITIAHPSWSNTYQRPDVLEKIQGRIRFCEVFNGLTNYSYKLGRQTDNGYPMCTFPEGKDDDFAWEILLDKGCVVWGIAVSDAHTCNNATEIKRGCVKVYADHNERMEILQNLCSGNFYSSTNTAVSINGVSFENGTLTIQTGDAEAITKFIGEGGEVLSTVTGATAAYTMTGSEMYVRAVVVFPNEEQVWTQPIINLFTRDYDDLFEDKLIG